MGIFCTYRTSSTGELAIWRNSITDRNTGIMDLANVRLCVSGGRIHANIIYANPLVISSYRKLWPLPTLTRTDSIYIRCPHLCAQTLNRLAQVRKKMGPGNHVQISDIVFRMHSLHRNSFLLCLPRFRTFLAKSWSFAYRRTLSLHPNILPTRDAILPRLQTAIILALSQRH